jgi:hypothetical protein
MREAYEDFCSEEPVAKRKGKYVVVCEAFRHVVCLGFVVSMCPSCIK